MLRDFRFRDRREAGRLLATKLGHYADRLEVIVLGLPRGGVPVAYEVAQALNVPLDVFMVRKLGVPGHEELAMGAVASGGIRFVNREVVEMLDIPNEELERVTKREMQTIEQRERLYRDDRPPLNLYDRILILVDDGLATGSTVRAAIAALRQQHPQRIVVAAPVAAHEVCEKLSEEVDEVVCAYTPDLFFAVGEWYTDFSEVSDDEVRDLLHTANERISGPSLKATKLALASSGGGIVKNRTQTAGEQHPKEWRGDLNPATYEPRKVGGLISAYDIKSLHRRLRDLPDDVLKQIPIVPEGLHLIQGSTYIDLADEQPTEFTATADMIAGTENYYVPKIEVDYELWNLLTGVEDPERLGEAKKRG